MDFTQFYETMRNRGVLLTSPGSILKLLHNREPQPVPLPQAGKLDSPGIRSKLNSGLIA